MNIEEIRKELTREEFIKRLEIYASTFFVYKGVSYGCPSCIGLKDTSNDGEDACKYINCHYCWLKSIKNIKFKGEDEVKSYTNSEVMEMLKHNSALKFEHENKDINVKMIISANKIGYINLRCEGCRDGMDGNIKLTDEWQLVQQPVSFMEAIKAYKNGKAIRCELIGTSKTYIPHANSIVPADNTCRPITVDEMLNGKWYIEDGE